jgi:hypothetical protein
MTCDISNAFKQNLLWLKTENVDFPYETSINKQLWKIRLNDFPEEPLYTLFIEGYPVFDFDEWPDNWQR